MSTAAEVLQVEMEIADAVAHQMRLLAWTNDRDKDQAERFRRIIWKLSPVPAYQMGRLGRR